MKFRTFMGTLLLFLVVYYLSLLAISLFILNSQMDSAKQRGLNEHYVIASSLGREIAAVAARSDTLADIGPYVETYADYYRQKGVYLEVIQNKAILHSNLPMGYNLTPDISPPGENYRHISTVTLRNTVFVCVSGALPGLEEGYVLRYLCDISGVLAAWRQIQTILVVLGAGFSVVLAVLLQLMLERVFRPLSLVSRASGEIARGRFGNRIPVQGKNEAAEMARDFNAMAEEIQRQIAALEKASEQKQQFVDNFSHEIRTPLTAIFGSADFLLKARTGEDERMQAAENILAESRYILNMADRLMELASLRHKAPVKKEIPVEKLFSSVADTLAVKLSEKEIDFQQQVRDSAIVLGDWDLMKSLLVNLMDNSIKASPLYGKILLKYYEDGGNAVITVRDEGSGMDMAEVEKITEPFYRIDKARNRKEGGAGLGLAICKQAADYLGAELAFETAAGAGTAASLIFTTL